MYAYFRNSTSSSGSNDPSTSSPSISQPTDIGSTPSITPSTSTSVEVPSDVKTVNLNVTIPSALSEGQHISIGSNVNSWNPASEDYIAVKVTDTTYRLSFSLDTKGIDVTMQYKYTIQDPSNDAMWDMVEKAEDGTELTNRTLKVEALGANTVEANDTVAQWADPNIVQEPTVVGNLTLHEGIAMPQFEDGRTRTLRVWTPEGYNAADTTKKYPVIYMQDGQNLFDAVTSYAGEWGVDESITNLMTSSGFEGAIVVGIDNSSKRMSEYTPNWGDVATAEGELYAKFIVETVKPLIDGEYNTNPSKTTTAIAGSSMGGLISFYTGLKHQDTFGMIGAFSSSFQVNTQDARQAFINSLTLDENSPRVYLDAGKQETLYSYVTPVANELYAAGLPANKIYTVIEEEGGHNEASWNRRFPDAITWLMGSEDGNYVAPDSILILDVTIPAAAQEIAKNASSDGVFGILINNKTQIIIFDAQVGDVFSAGIEVAFGSTFTYNIGYYVDKGYVSLETTAEGVIAAERSIDITSAETEVAISVASFEKIVKVSLEHEIPANSDDHLNTISPDGAYIFYTGSLSSSIVPTVEGNKLVSSIYGKEGQTTNYLIGYYISSIGKIIYATNGQGLIYVESAVIGSDNSTHSVAVVGWQVQVNLTVNVTIPEVTLEEGQSLLVGLYGGQFGGSWRDSQMTHVGGNDYTIVKTVYSGSIELTAGYVVMVNGSPVSQTFEKDENGTTKKSAYNASVDYATHTVGTLVNKTINHTVVTF